MRQVLMQEDLQEDTMDRDTFDGTIRAFKQRTPFSEAP
jgi:hypothetical protein